MIAAAITIDITPPIGIPIAGNIREDNISRGVHDPILCNAVLIESEGVRVLMLAMDWLGIDKKDATFLRRLTGTATGAETSHVVVSATHTHSGPDVFVSFGSSERRPDVEAYVQNAFKKIVRHVSELPAAMENCSFWKAQKNVNDLSFNRRLRLADGSLKMNWMPVDPDEVICTTGPIDPSLTVVGLKREDESWLALMVNFTLHAAVLVGRDWLWSTDYVGYVRQAVYNRFSQKPVIHFTNGAEGDVNHLNYSDIHQLDWFPEAERIGTALANHILDALQTAETMPDRMQCTSATVSLIRRSIPERLKRWARIRYEQCGGRIPSLLHGIPDEVYAREILQMESFFEPVHEVLMVALLFGDVAAVTLPGEIFCQIGLNIKKGSPFKNTVTLGLSNDFCGYIPDEKAFLEGGYEPRMGYYSRYAESSQQVIEHAAISLLNLLKQYN